MIKSSTPEYALVKVKNTSDQGGGRGSAGLTRKPTGAAVMAGKVAGR